MSDRILITLSNIPPEALAKDLLFDTNLWLRIHGCLLDPSDFASSLYSAFYRKVLEAGIKIYLPQLVVSEFVSVSLHIKAKEAGWDKTQRGKIHQHPDFPTWISDISDDLHHVVKDCVKLDDFFDEIELADIFTTTGSARMDFNDVLMSELCVRQNIRIVTHDADFCLHPVSIITGIQRLIKNSPAFGKS